MWIFLREAMLSIVDPSAHYTADQKLLPKPGEMSKVLLVRARLPGDIQRVFPGYSVKETPYADYRFRALVARAEVARALALAAMNIDYGNFKAGVKDHLRHDAYLGCWSAMQRAQVRRAPRWEGQRVMFDSASDMEYFEPPRDATRGGRRRR